MKYSILKPRHTPYTVIDHLNGFEVDVFGVLDEIEFRKKNNNNFQKSLAAELKKER